MRKPQMANSPAALELLESDLHHCRPHPSGKAVARQVADDDRPARRDHLGRDDGLAEEAAEDFLDDGELGEFGYKRRVTAKRPDWEYYTSLLISNQ